MSLAPAVLDAMLAAGCSAEQIVAAVKADVAGAVEAAAERRERDRLRKRDQRAAEKSAAKSTVGSDLSSGQSGTPWDGADSPPPFPDKKSPQTPKELTLSAPAFPPRGDFDGFWALFPNKVGKADALKAFLKALQRVDIETLLIGLARYVRKTDDRPWCNPATWLNQDRWTDEPATLPRGSPPAKSRGVGGVFGDIVEHLENGQDDSDRGGQAAAAPVLSLPYRRTG